MTVNYSPDVKSGRMGVVADVAKGGRIEVGTIQMAVILASFALPNPAFSEADGIITLLGTPMKTTAIAAGTAASARIRDMGGNIKVDGLTVGLSGADLNLNAIALKLNQEVTIASGMIRHS
jgi:hypothetical protein